MMTALALFVLLYGAPVPPPPEPPTPGETAWVFERRPTAAIIKARPEMPPLAQGILCTNRATLVIVRESDHQATFWCRDDRLPLTPGESAFLRHYCTPRDDWGAICRRLLERDEASRKEER